MKYGMMDKRHLSSEAIEDVWFSDKLRRSFNCLILLFLTEFQCQVNAQAVSPTYATCRSDSVCIPLVKCLNIRSLPNWLTAGETCGPGPFALRQVCCSGPTLKPSIRPHCGQSPFYYDQNKSNEEIVVDSLEGQWPWMVGLFVHKPNDEYKQICSGFLIDSRHVISAASCFKDKDDKEIQYQARIGNIFNNLGETYLISHIAVPGSFKSPMIADNIAVLTLDRVVDSSIGRPICLPDETISSMNLTGTSMTAAGWVINKQRAKIARIDAFDIHAHGYTYNSNRSAPFTQLFDNDTNTCSSLEVKDRDTEVSITVEKQGKYSALEIYLPKGTTAMQVLVATYYRYFSTCSMYKATLEKSQWVFLHCSEPNYLSDSFRITSAENKYKNMTICEIIVYFEDDPQHRLSLKHQMQKPVWSNKECNSVQRQSTELLSLSKELPRGIDNGFICTGFRQGHCDPFAGGPLMFKDRGRWFAVGISGTQVGCGLKTSTSPALYARISEYIDFIKDNTKD